jgi:hypothetical protein
MYAKRDSKKCPRLNRRFLPDKILIRTTKDRQSTIDINSTIRQRSITIKHFTLCVIIIEFDQDQDDGQLV